MTKRPESRPSGNSDHFTIRCTIEAKIEVSQHMATHNILAAAFDCLDSGQGLLDPPDAGGTIALNSQSGAVVRLATGSYRLPVVGSGIHVFVVAVGNVTLLHSGVAISIPSGGAGMLLSLGDGLWVNVSAASVERHQYDIRNYGAVLDGVTDDFQAIQDAVDAADAAGGGTVYHPGGTALMSEGVEIPVDSRISLVGESGFSIFKAKSGSTPFTAMFNIQSTVGGVGSRFGRFADFSIDGNDIAARGIQCQTVQREYQNIVIQKCTQAGLYCDGGQNNTFISINAEDNGTTGTTPFYDGNLVLDLGARNNAFIRCQFGAASGNPANRGKYNIVFCQTAVSDIADGEPPSFNKFYGCQLERVSQSHLGAILQSAGRYNTFTDCLLQSLNLPIVTITDDDGYDSGTMRFSDCIFSSNTGANSRVGVVTSTTAALPGIIINGGNLAEGFETLFTVADGACVDINGVFYTGAEDIVENHDTGTDEISQLVARRELVLPVVPSGAPNLYLHYRSQFYSNSDGRRYIYNGGAWHYWPQTSP